MLTRKLFLYNNTTKNISNNHSDFKLTGVFLYRNHGNFVDIMFAPLTVNIVILACHKKNILSFRAYSSMNFCIISWFIKVDNNSMNTENFYAKFDPLNPVIIPQRIHLTTNPLCTLLAFSKTWIICSLNLCSVFSSISPNSLLVQCSLPLNTLALLC